MNNSDNKTYTKDELLNHLEEFGNFIRDNYYGVGAPKLLSYNPAKYPHGTIKKIRDTWTEENLNDDIKTRALAMEWWNKKLNWTKSSNEGKENLTMIYKPLRYYSTLTGREIEEIYKQETKK